MHILRHSIKHFQDNDSFIIRKVSTNWNCFRLTANACENSAIISAGMLALKYHKLSRDELCWLLFIISSIGFLFNETTVSIDIFTKFAEAKFSK